MGWLWLGLLAGASVLLLRRLGLAGPLGSMALAAVLLGCAGYALQGRPRLAGSPVSGVPAAAQMMPDSNALRDAMYGSFNADVGYVMAADAMAKSGDNRNAARAVIGGIARIPNSYILWSELGSVMAMHDANQVSPTALFAFQRAIRLAPMQPAPKYMLGLAYVRAGDLPRALAAWRAALALVPPGVAYREDLAERVALLDRVIAEQS